MHGVDHVGIRTLLVLEPSTLVHEFISVHEENQLKSLMDEYRKHATDGISL